MEPLIYYPTFEPPDDLWIKYALLYFEKFRPIVPDGNWHMVSDTFRKVHDHSDLIDPYSPDNQVGYRASLKAIEEAEKMLKNKYQYAYMFKHINLEREWRDPLNRTFKIHAGKFSVEWMEFCLEREIGIRDGADLVVPENVAFLFMSYLAGEIAFDQGAAIITDNKRFDNYTSFWRYSRLEDTKVQRRNDFTKGVVDLKVPTDLSTISFDRLLAFRETNRELLRAFNAQILKVQDKIGEGYCGQDFIEEYKYVYRQMEGELVKLGMGLIGIPLGFYILMQNPHVPLPPAAKEMLGAAGIGVSGYYSLRKGLRDTQSARYCKKYLAKLRKLH